MSNDAPRRPGEGRRLTKAERKEQARREREELQRKLASKRRARTVGMAAGGAVIAAVAAAATLLPSGGEFPEPAQLLQRASAAATAAECDDVATTPPFDPEDEDRTHIGGGVISGPALSDYPTLPPASGPHADVPLPAGVYDTLTLSELYRSIHSLEHGASVVWYDPKAPVGEVARLREFYDRRLQDAQVGQDRVIVAPYDIPGDAAGILPEGTEMALVSWHRLRSCAGIDLAVAFDFTSQYSFPTAEDREYTGVAPEPGGSLG